MRRREVITLLGSAAAWPMAARAQQRERMQRVGVLMDLAADDPEGQARLSAFLQGLQEFGWAVGRNLQLDYRWVAGDPDRFRAHAAELVEFAPKVIFAAGTPSVSALQQASSTVATMARYAGSCPAVQSAETRGGAREGRGGAPHELPSEKRCHRPADTPPRI
jgi:hypothetical protein